MPLMLGSFRYSLFCMNDIQHLFKNQAQNSLINFASHPTTTTTALQYFNRRVTQRRHRHQSMKKIMVRDNTSFISLSCIRPLGELMS